MSDFYFISSLVLILLLIYPFVIYPLILLVLSKFFSKSVEKSSFLFPEISVVIAAYNEEEMIEDCIRSIFNSDYPSEKISVLVGSDGSTDGTISILKKLQKEFPSVQYFKYPRSGKNKILNNLVGKVRTELTYFLDADLRFDTKTISTVVSNFADKNVGACFTPYKIMASTDKNMGSMGEKLYQSFEKFLRFKESQVWSNINSIGACCFRTNLIMPIPNDKVCDDLYYILGVNKQKYRVVFDNSTFKYEIREKDIRDEFHRRIRLIGGGLATVKSMSSLLSPSAGWVAFFLWSHKMIRWASPLFLILIFILSMLMEKSIFREILFLAQYFLYISAFSGYVFELTKVRFNIFKIPLFYITMNISFVYGIIRFLMQKQNAIWDRSGLA